MLVSFFSFTMLTSMSSSRVFSPTIMPSYTRSPGSMNISPRSCTCSMRVGGDLAGAVGDQRAGHAVRDVALPRLVAVEQVVQQPGAARVGEELVAEADEAARGDAELQPHAPGAVVDHVDHAARGGCRSSASRRRRTPPGSRSTRCSIGSWRTPSISRVMTSGLLTASSKPSRRIVSMRMAICSSPRPETLKASGVSPGSTRRLTLVSSSRSRRSLRLREVTYLPLPAGERRGVDLEHHADGGLVHDDGGSGRGSSASVMVSPMLTSSKPASATMSPGPGLLDLGRARGPRRRRGCVTARPRPPGRRAAPAPRPAARARAR